MLATNGGRSGHAGCVIFTGMRRDQSVWAKGLEGAGDTSGMEAAVLEGEAGVLARPLIVAGKDEAGGEALGGVGMRAPRPATDRMGQGTGKQSS